MTRAGMYVRISQDQEGRALGVTRQLEDCEALAQQLGWEVAEVYTDNDISATSGKPRPAYRSMLTAIDAGQIEAIIAWHPDRLYRRAKELGELVDTCKRNSTQVATVRAGLMDLTTPTGRLVAGLVAQVAIYEGEAKSDRWKRSIRQRREAGDPPTWGPRMYGYERDGTLVFDEADRIREWATALLDGVSIRSLVNQINAAGLQTSLKNPWTATGIRKLLTNPRLAGHSTLSRQEPTGKRDANGEPIMRQVVETVGVGKWEPILDHATYEQVRALLNSRTGAPRRPRVALLLGLAHCGKCGTRMITGGRAARGNAPSQRVYRCPTVAGGITGCGGVSIIAEPVEELVEAYAKARVLTATVRERVAELRGSAAALVPELVALEERVLELERQLDEPGVPVATILRARDRTQEKVNDLQARIAVEVPRSLPATSAQWPVDLGQRRALVDLVVKKVTIQPTTWKTGGRVFDPERVEVEGR